MKPARRMNLDTLGHDARANVVAHSIVIAGNDGESALLEQWREEFEKTLMLDFSSAVRDVAGYHHMIDAAAQKTDRYLASGAITLRRTAEVKVRKMRQRLKLHASLVKEPGNRRVCPL